MFFSLFCPRGSDKFSLSCAADVLKEFAAKKCVKLGKLLEKGGMGVDKRKLSGGSGLNPNPNPESLHSATVNWQKPKI